MKRKWEYRVDSRLDLPPGASVPIMDSRDMAWRLNEYDKQGWELVTYGQTKWHDMPSQEWWVFRRPVTKAV